MLGTCISSQGCSGALRALPQEGEVVTTDVWLPMAETSQWQRLLGLPGEWEVLSISWHKGKTQFYLLIYKYCCVYRHLIDVNIIPKLSNTEYLILYNNNQ